MLTFSFASADNINIMKAEVDMDFDGINLDFDGRNPFKVWRELYQVVPSSRPNRVKAINSEDITNLKIAFVIHDDVLDFLEDPYLFS